MMVYALKQVINEMFGLALCFITRIDKYLAFLFRVQGLAQSFKFATRIRIQSVNLLT